MFLDLINIVSVLFDLSSNPEFMMLVHWLWKAIQIMN